MRLPARAGMRVEVPATATASGVTVGVPTVGEIIEAFPDHLDVLVRDGAGFCVRVEVR